MCVCVCVRWCECFICIKSTPFRLYNRFSNAEERANEKGKREKTVYNNHNIYSQDNEEGRAACRMCSDCSRISSNPVDSNIQIMFFKILKVNFYFEFSKHDPNILPAVASRNTPRYRTHDHMAGHSQE